VFLLFILDLNCSLNNLDKATARNTMEAALLRTLSDTQQPCQDKGCEVQCQTFIRRQGE
jgi:hypothetical protein